MQHKLIRTTTVPISMNIILRGQLGFMNQYFEVIGITGKDEKHFFEIQKREKIRMHPISMARSINLLADIQSLWKFYLFLKQEKPTILHTHTPKAGLIGMLAGWLVGVPIRLHTVGGMPLLGISGLKRKILEQTERLTYRLADRVYPNSHGLMEIIVRHKFADKKKLKVIGNGGSNGINVNYFDPKIFKGDEFRKKMRTKIGLKQDDIVLCFVGRIAAEKGIIELLKAMKYLVLEKKYKHLKLILVGTFEKEYGILDSSVIELINNTPFIKFLGRFDDVRPYYALSDIFVLPSYREGFPNALLEAAAMSLPVITTDINGCNEIIENDYNGLIIPTKNTKALIDAIKILIEDAPYRAKLAKQSRKRIVEKFKREYVWQQLLKEYQLLVNNLDHKSRNVN